MKGPPPRKPAANKSVPAQQQVSQPGMQAGPQQATLTPDDNQKKQKLIIGITIASLIILLTSIICCSAAGIGIAAATGMFSKSGNAGKSGQESKARSSSSGKTPESEDDASEKEKSEKKKEGKSKQEKKSDAGNDQDNPQQHKSGGSPSTQKDSSSSSKSKKQNNPPGEGAFFGIQDDGASYVYVVDCSGSMAGSRWDRCRKELTRSVRSLTTDKSFFVILFADTKYPMFWPRSLSPTLVKCSGENIDGLRSWLNTFALKGATNPESALVQAIQMKPEVIFFLTDGEFDTGIPRAIQSANTSKIRINTICFESNSGSVLTRKIADDSGGVYRFVK